MEKYYPKDLWKVRVNGTNIVMKAKQETLEQLWNEDKIIEYTPLVAYKVKGEKR